MSLLQNSNAISTGGAYNLESSLRFRSSANSYLQKTLSASRTDAKKQTISVWVKRGKIGALQSIIGGYDGASANRSLISFHNTDYLEFYTGYSSNILYTSSIFRDPSAWYHIVYTLDSTQATSTNRVKLYINGVQQTLNGTYPPSNYNFQFVYPNANNYIGTLVSGNRQFDGYMTEFNFVDGQALTADDFGETDTTTGVWKPKEYTGTYGTNGFYLDMSTSSSTVLDQSSNSNDWTANNMNLTTSSATTYDIMNDVPTLTDEDTANFATMNPLYIHVNGYALPTFSNGNLTVEAPASNVFRWARASIFPTSGAYYYEMYVDTYGSNSTAIQVNTGSTYTSYTGGNGDIFVNGSSVGLYSTWTTGDTLGVALDIDNGDVTYYKNGTQVYTTSSQTYDGEVKIGHFTDYGGKVTYNFGQRPFKYTPPTGYKKLNTYNLPDSTIADGSQYFDAVTYTGDGGTSNSLSYDFSPDLVWSKSRSNAESNVLYDSIRGNDKYLVSNNTNAEGTLSPSAITFDSNGHTWTYPYSASNTSGYTYVNWVWRGSDSSAVSNTDGTITSTVSANTTSGFSVVTYTGTGANATVGHGLGVAPNMMIIKNRSGTNYWAVYHSSVGNTGALILSSTSATDTSSLYWNNTSPTSSVFTVQNAGAVNASGGNYVAYCFADVEGFSKFGSYTGNGSSDGPFIYTGFRPAFVLYKRTNSTGNWAIHDTARSPYNQMGDYLLANDSAAEVGGSVLAIDALSNGFKIRTTQANQNASGGTYIYMAFAENPMKNSLAR